ncbi:DegV family protein [Streptococcus entericus]|uniref:DegV family protein n=1 Tax=Streptococcus entericus TaxID=155680 RepID=UPI000372035F|nr:DegV family protein [Streptococcus entericus]
MTWKIIVDSGCNFRELPNLAAGVQFVNVPLTIQVGEQIFVDDAGLDIDQMMDLMYATPTASKSACPSPEAYRQALEGASKAIIITITGTLSGSNNSARLGSEMYLEEHPEAQVHIFDSLSAGGEQDLLALKLNDLIASGLGFEDVVAELKTYHRSTKLAFALAKVDNLVKNGRLSKLVGTVVGLLNIRMVGQASDEGTLELLQKARGQKKAVTAVIEEMVKAGYKGGRVMISHRNNDKICEQITEGLTAKFPNATIQSIPTSGLCSFYAEEGGILLGYEI